MNFFSYLVLGGLSYAAGWATRKHVLPPADVDAPYSFTHPKIVMCMLAFFVLMLPISALISRYALGHEGLDVLFVVVNSAAATFVYSFGLNPDQKKYDLPD
ncbi:hypothetical protein [Psychrobacter aestuarii]|uniref:Uncharacterized protein n=1 Tax=Psychrobacter aestuarii TaxID=556327 RepID=A0ABP3FDB3_9GAMM|nr:hypothetical protein [Psychrobacter aestuarii]